MISKEAYTKALADSITVSVEDLNPTELELIDKAYGLFKGALIEQKTLEDEVKRLSIELANVKAMTDYRDERINDNYLREDDGDI